MGTRPLPTRPGAGADRWFQLKQQIHLKLLNSLSPDQLKAINKSGVREQIGNVVERIVADENMPMTLAERERLIEDVLDEVFGLGPLEPLLKDPTISEIMVNGFDNVYVERAGRVVETNVRFKDTAHVRMIIDRIVSFILTCQLALPGRLLAMALVFLIGPSVGVVICVIGFLHWSYYLVVTRAATQKIRDLEYITAARAIGSSRLQIMVTEILPNLFSEIIVIFSLEVGVAVLAEAALSFLGVGIQPPTSSWGLMIAEGKVSVFLRPWLVILPGMMILVTVASLNILGNALRDALDPRAWGR